MFQDPIATQAAAGGPSPGVAAAFDAGGSILNSILGGIASRRQNKRMVDFWNMNNAYNHPSAQMARLREAGLNPHLIYGSNASGATGTSSAPPRSEEETRLNVGQPLSAYQQTRIQNLQADNLRAQQTNIMQDTALKTANTLKATNEAGIKGKMHQIISRTLEDQISRIQSESMRSFNRAELEFQTLDRQRLSPVQREMLSQRYFKSLLDDYKLKGENASNAEKLGLLRDAENQVKKLDLDFYESRAWIGLITRILGLPMVTNKFK